MTSPSTKRTKISRTPRNAPAVPSSQHERPPAPNSSPLKSSHQDPRTHALCHDHQFELPSRQQDLNLHVPYPLSSPLHQHRLAAQQEYLQVWLRKRRRHKEQLHERPQILLLLRELDEERGQCLLPLRRKLVEVGRSVIQVIRAPRLWLENLLLRRRWHR